MRYFRPSEFDSPDQPGSGNKMNSEFLNKLELAREIAEIPFIITSAYRSDKHNSRIGGVDSSAHTKGHAVDISCRDSRSRWKIIDSLIAVGFNRIGIADTFIHVDDDPDKPMNVIWTY